MYNVNLLNIYFFSILLSFFSVLFPMSDRLANRYNGIFSQEIYEQDIASLRATGSTESQIDVCLVELLYQNKRAQINKLVISGLQDKVQALIESKKRELSTQLAGGAIGAATGLLNIIGSVMTFRFGDAFSTGVNLARSAPVGGRAAVGDRRAAGAGGAQASNFMVGGAQAGRALGDAIVNITNSVNVMQGRVDEVFEQAERLGIFTTELAGMKWEREQLLNGIKSEVWHEFEEIYVKKKRFLDPALQRSFEDKFVSARALAGIGVVQYLGFFKDALALPTEVKKIGGQVDPDQAARAALLAFDEHPKLQRYGPITKNELKKLIITAIYCSHFDKQAIRRPYLRRAFYFYGPPGAGKSAAARAIPIDILKVPCCEKTVFDMRSVTEQGLLGTSLWSSNSSPGWLGEALTARDDDGKSYQNSFLILNDFDRILMEGNKSALALLLYLLDPETKKTKSPFFDGPLDISNLFILLDGNQCIVAQPQIASGAAAGQSPQPARKKQLGGAVGVAQSQPVGGAGGAAAAAEVPEAAQQFDPYAALDRRLKTIPFEPFPEEQKRVLYAEQVRNLMALFKMPDIQGDTQARTIDEALRQPGLAEGFVHLSEKYTDFKLSSFGAKRS